MIDDILGGLFELLVFVLGCYAVKRVAELLLKNGDSHTGRKEEK